MLFFAFGVSLTFIIRIPLCVKLCNKDGYKSIYFALYFYPALLLVHVVLGGLICKCWNTLYVDFAVVRLLFPLLGHCWLLCRWYCPICCKSRRNISRERIHYWMGDSLYVSSIWNCQPDTILWIDLLAAFCCICGASFTEGFILRNPQTSEQTCVKMEVKLQQQKQRQSQLRTRTRWLCNIIIYWSANTCWKLNIFVNM